jgi:hypothetical protein
MATARPVFLTTIHSRFRCATPGWLAETCRLATSSLIGGTGLPLAYSTRSARPDRVRPATALRSKSPLPTGIAGWDAP